MSSVTRMSWQGAPSLAMLCLLISVQISTISAFRCYVCDSKDNIECTENLPANSRLISHECQNITGAKFCIKTTNIYAGEFGTKRFCAANDHGNYCKYVRQPTGDREYRSCVLTCDSENCNGSCALFEGRNIIYVASITMILAIHIFLTTLSCNLISISTIKKASYDGRI